MINLSKADYEDLIGRTIINKEVLELLAKMVDSYEGVCLAAGLKPESHAAYFKAKSIVSAWHIDSAKE